MKVLVATEKPFAAVAVDSIRKVIEDAGYELELLEKYPSREELLAAVADADALIVRSDKADAEVIAAAKKLKVIVRAGAGYDNIDLAAATAAGICVENTPGQNSNAVAELVFGMAVMAARNMYDGTSGSERIRSGRAQCSPDSQRVRHGGVRSRPVLSRRVNESGRSKSGTQCQ